MVKIITVERYSLAMMLKEVLENEGIEVVLKKKDPLTSVYQSEMGVFFLDVLEKDEKRAREIIDSVEDLDELEAGEGDVGD
ncbi:DUF2007 domain-containing protein [bacterium]|nr:DUF2007 domain-containing protein [bacterium]